MENIFHIRDWVSIGMFGLALVGAIATYFKTMSDMRSETQSQFYNFGREIRAEIREQYATKQETQFQHETLVEIKAHLKDLNQKLEAKRLI